MIIRKDQLQLVSTDSEVLNTPPAPYVFDGDAVNIANVLFDRMKELGGVGLSANQVGLNIRAFVMGFDDQARVNVFNPVILEHLGEEVSIKEGCLSFPGLFMTVRRPSSIRVKYQNELGEEIDTILTGLSARVFLHEYDHMEGKNFTSRVSKLKLDLAKKKYQNKKAKIIKKHAHKVLIDALRETQ